MKILLRRPFSILVCKYIYAKQQEEEEKRETIKRIRFFYTQYEHYEFYIKSRLREEQEEARDFFPSSLLFILALDYNFLRNI